jgi:biopolymer transport protein ExbD
VISRKTARISAGFLGLLSEGLLLTAYIIETTSRAAILSLMILTGAIMLNCGGAEVGERGSSESWMGEQVWDVSLSANGHLDSAMRTTLMALCLLALAQFATGQGAPSDTSADALRIRVSADGTCYSLDLSTSFVDVGRYLSSKHLAQNGHVDVVVDRASKYELVAAALKSLQSAGFGHIGFVKIQ